MGLIPFYFSRWLQNETVDWDEVMRDGNRWFDLLIEAADKPTWPDCCDMFWKMDKKLTDELDHPPGGHMTRQLAQMNLYFGKIDPTIHSLQMFEIMAGILSPAGFAASLGEYREEAHFQLARLSLALAAYQSEHGDFPARLEELAPHFLKKLPSDPFSAAAFCYRRQPKGYVVYSVGWNGKDDGGRDADTEPTGDDIVVRVPPIPERPPKQPVVQTPEEKVRELIAKLRDPDPRQRARAATALGAMESKASAAAGPLVALLADTASPDEFGPATVSVAAAMALEAIGEPAVLPLISALKDHNTTVRKMAVYALSGIKDPRVTTPLLERVKDEDAGVRQVAIAVLRGNDDPRIKDAVIAAVADPSVAVRGEVVDSLGRIRDPRATKLLVAALSEKDRSVLLNAAMSLTEQAASGVKEPAAVTPLLALLKDADPEIRSTSAQALGEIGDRRAVEGLIALVDDQVPMLRVRAANALAELKDPRALAALKPLLTDKVEIVRTAAKKAIEAIAAGDGKKSSP